MIGGLTGGGKVTTSFVFPVAQPWALESASQATITETESLTAPTPVTYVRGQDTNTVQIFQKKVSVSYAKQSNYGQVYPLSSTQNIQQGKANPITNELDFQINANMRQIAIDADYTFLNGTYALATAANVAAGTRGIITATSTNAVAAGSVLLSKDLMDEAFRTMAANGAVFDNLVIFANAFQVQMLSEIYGFAPQSQTVGGVAIDTIITPIVGKVGVVWEPQVSTSTLALIDVAHVSPVFCPVPGKGVLFYEELSKTGASESGQIYGQMGIDYGPEEFHGKITGLSTSK